MAKLITMVTCKKDERILIGARFFECVTILGESEDDSGRDRPRGQRAGQGSESKGRCVSGNGGRKARAVGRQEPTEITKC